MSSFGPVLLEGAGTQRGAESSLGLVFHYADQAGLPLLDLKDRAVLTHLTSDEGKAELKSIGGLSTSTVSRVILRTLITFARRRGRCFLR